MKNLYLHPYCYLQPGGQLEVTENYYASSS